MALRPVECPSGEVLRPAICSGEEHCVAGSCEEGQVCYRGTNDRAVCLPETLCPAWASEGVANPVLESDEERKRRLLERERRPKPVTRAPSARRSGIRYPYHEKSNSAQTERLLLFLSTFSRAVWVSLISLPVIAE